MTKKLLHRCNDRDSVIHALQNFDGLECDLRLASNGVDIYLGHEATGHAQLDLADPLTIAIAAAPGKTLALNVKETGMCTAFNKYFALLCSVDYFLFDVPGVELNRYHSMGLRVFGRLSRYELQRPLNGGGLLIDPYQRGDQQELFINAGIGHPLQVSSGVETALISNGCHGRFDEPNLKSPAITYLIGKEQEL